VKLKNCENNARLKEVQPKSLPVSGENDGKIISTWNSGYRHKADKEHMYFKDLELCSYHPGPLDAAEWAVPLRAVGWLEHPNRFEVGEVSAGIVARLRQLLEQTNYHFPHYHFRGGYECSFCKAGECITGGAGWSQDDRFIWSQDNLIIPGVGEVYAAPGAIVHYITDHLYRPPATFLEAVVSCPECGSEEYFETLRRTNGGQDPPMETDEQDTRRFRKDVITTFNNIGAFYQVQGQYSQALKSYNQALVIAQEIGNKVLEQSILKNIESLPKN
jgi:hypothetical protein